MISFTAEEEARLRVQLAEIVDEKVGEFALDLDRSFNHGCEASAPQYAIHVITMGEELWEIVLDGDFGNHVVYHVIALGDLAPVELRRLIGIHYDQCGEHA